MNANLYKDDIIIKGRFKKNSGGKLGSDVNWKIHLLASNTI